MAMSDAQIISKAKLTPFGNDTWINLRDKTVYEAMKYCLKSRSFTLGYTQTLTIEKLVKMGYKGKNNKQDIIDFLVEKKEIDKLRIEYNQVFQGNYIRGKLRVQTYLILKGYKNVD